MSKLLNKAEILDLTGLSYPYIWELMRRGEFPRSIRLSDSTAAVRWYTDEVLAWVESRPRSRLKGDDPDAPPPSKFPRLKFKGEAEAETEAVSAAAPAE